MASNDFRIRGVVLGELQPSDVLIRDGKIHSITPAGRAKCDAGSPTSIIGPTLFDIQVNGYGGTDLQGRDVLPEDVAKVDAKLQRIGVSHWIPTFITSSFENIEHGCATVAAALKDTSLSRRIPGVHIEGPYISPYDGPRGAHDKRHVRKPNLREFDKWHKAADGRVAYITLAPEIDGAIPFIKEMVKRGIVVSLGHHNATPDDIVRAVDAGARMCTHLGNGISSTINRHHNPLWPQMAEDRLLASVIADLEHLPPPLLKTIARVKGPDRLMITSDAVHIAGLKPGHYDLAGMPVELLKTGRIQLTGTDLLAGSATTLLQAVLNAVRHTDLTLAQAFACASRIPAELFGVSNASTRANLIVFDLVSTAARDSARIQTILVDGARLA